MNRCKRFYSLLCFLLVFCVGFLSIGNIKVYAYEGQENFYPLLIENSYLRSFEPNFTNGKNFTPTIKDNKYYYNNPELVGIDTLQWTANVENGSEPLTFPYNPDLYDYYFIGNLVGLNTDYNKSTFKPQSILMYGTDYATQALEYYPLSGLNVYDIDSNFYSGFGWYTKVDFASRDNIGLNFIYFSGDKDGTGNKPANLILDMGILAVEKSGSESVILNQILNQLKSMEDSITENIQNNSHAISSAVGQAGEKVSGAVNEAGDKIANKVEEQYKIDDSEDFDVDYITDEVEEKLGVLTVGTDTLVGFLDLFSPANVGSTRLTFPSFSIKVQGSSYKVWDDISYDLSSLENDFGILLDAVRTVTVLCVWLAVLSYIIKAKDHFINNRG